MVSPFPSRPSRFSSGLPRRLLGGVGADGRYVVDGVLFTGIGYRLEGTDRYVSLVVRDGRVVGPFVDELVGPGPLVDLDVQYEDDFDGYVNDPDWWYHGAPFTGLASDLDDGFLRSVSRVEAGIDVEKHSFHLSGNVAYHWLDLRFDPEENDGIELVRQSLSWRDDGTFRRSHTSFFAVDHASSASLDLVEDGTIRRIWITAGYTGDRVSQADRLTMWALDDLGFLDSMSGHHERVSLGLGDRAGEVVDRLTAGDGLASVRSLRVDLDPPLDMAALDRLLNAQLRSLTEFDVTFEGDRSIDVFERVLAFKRDHPSVDVLYNITRLIPVEELAAARRGPSALCYSNGFRDLVIASGFRVAMGGLELVEELLSAPTLRVVAQRQGGPGDAEMIELIRRLRPDIELVEQSGRPPRPDWVDLLEARLDEFNNKPTGQDPHPE